MSFQRFAILVVCWMSAGFSRAETSVELCEPLGSKVFGFNIERNLEYKDEILGWKDSRFNQKRKAIEEGLRHEGYFLLGSESIPESNQCSALQIIPQSTLFVEMNVFGQNPKYFLRAIVTEKKKIIDFYKSEKAGKQQIEISDSIYNKLARLAVGIMGAESSLGHSDAFAMENMLSKMGIVENMAVCLKNELRALKEGRPLPKCQYFGDPKTSRGFTQIKEIPKIGMVYGITRNNLDAPNLSGIATMGFLIETYKWYLQTIQNYECSYTIEEGSEVIRHKMTQNDFEIFVTYLYRGDREELILGTATPQKNCYYKRVQKYLEYVSFYVHPEQSCEDVDPIILEKTEMNWKGQVIN